MNACDAGSGRRSLSSHSVDVRLHADVCGRFQLQVPAPLVFLEVLRQRAFDVAWSGVVTLDQVAVVRVHDADEVRQMRRGPRVECRAERGRRGSQVGQYVQHRLRRVLETRGFYSRRTLWHLSLADYSDTVSPYSTVTYGTSLSNVADLLADLNVIRTAQPRA